MTDAFLAGMGTALPHRVSTERFLEVDREMRRRHGQSEETCDLVQQLAKGTGILFRHTINPGWLPEGERPNEPEDIFTPTDFDPPAFQRARLWKECAPGLSVAAARAALSDWGGRAEDITHVVTSSTSGWSEPGLACEIIHQLGLSLDCQKVELNFNGCFCGMTCLRIARDMIRAGAARAVLVVAAETSSCQYDVVETDMSTLVANVLFGDGAGAAVLAPEGRWKFEQAGMSLVPDTGTMLAWAPELTAPRETYRMVLHRQIGARLAQFFRDERGRDLLDRIVAHAGAERPALGVHPGGPNILGAIHEVFLERGWREDALEASFKTLHSIGNLGSAAILHVLARLWQSNVAEERIATFAFGPGVTVEWGILQRCQR